MKTIKMSLLCLSLLLLASCNTKDVIINDFENGTFDKWKVEGEAFGPNPTEKPYEGQQNIDGFQGKYWANSFYKGDTPQGKLISNSFVISHNYINFLMGGGTTCYVELIIDNEVVLTSHPAINSEALSWYTWDVEKYKNKTATIQVVDNQSGSWGHILVDHFEMSNKAKYEILTNGKLTFNANKKYLLIPIEDKAESTPITIEVDGKRIGMPIDVRLANTQIDYWVPISIEEYAGANINMTIGNTRKSSVGYKSIQASDKFEFDYNEQYRPHYHFSPQYGWMNDPNGMIYHNGEYHLYFQHNPYGVTWGNMHWGHTVTKDLKRWEYEPVAIAPDSVGAIFSGSAIVDKNNTAGFGENALIAIYTSAAEAQTQSIAYSLDNGHTFTKYENNPVLTDSTYVDFRDPKVFWHDKSSQWIMSLATTQVITFYGSKNLKEWTKLSDFGNGIGSHDGVWECPDLFPLPYNGSEKWVLLVSINPGGPNGGSATQYFIGNFDGKKFVADKMEYPIWLDYGRDNYAGVTWTDAPNNRRVFIGWMSNWDYSNQVPSINFHNASTLPRELKLTHNGKSLVLANAPVKEILELRNLENSQANIQVANSYTIDKIQTAVNGAYEIEMIIKPQSAKKFSFKLKNRKKEEMSFTFDLQSEKLIVNRDNSGVVDFTDSFAKGDINSPLVKKNEYRIRLYVDKASTELFVNDGELVQTNTVFPTEPFNTLQIESEGTIQIENMSVYNL